MPARAIAHVVTRAPPVVRLDNVEVRHRTTSEVLPTVVTVSSGEVPNSCERVAIVR